MDYRGKRILKMIKKDDFKSGTSESNIYSQFSSKASNSVEKASFTASSKANNYTTEGLVLPCCSKDFSQNTANASKINIPHRSTSDYSYSEDDDDSVMDKTWDTNSATKQQIIDSSDSEIYSDLIPMPEKSLNIENESVPLFNQNKEDQNRKRSRWSKSNPAEWTKNVAKQRRYACLPYRTKKGMHEAKYPRPVDCKKCRFKCVENFDENNRVEICKIFWGLSDYQRQKDFILKHVNSHVPSRPGANVSPNKKRTCSRSFHFIKNGLKIRVCQKIFQKTLCISNGPINTAFKGQNDGSFTLNDKRGKKSPSNKTKSEDIDFVKQHIQMFPTMASHYCRAKSQRQYLDSKLSISRMYALYEEFCRDNTKTPLSINMYRKIFCSDFNLSFFVPKKDQCCLCNQYNEANKTGTLSEDLITKYRDHQSRKDQANRAKDRDKQKSNSDPEFLSVTADLQKVLQIPSASESLLYYSRKLCIYNFTIYESKMPNDAYCFVWSELNGKRGSNEIGSAIMHWINKLPDTIKEICIFSDTCGGQNRNQHIAALFLYLTQTTHLNIIEQKFLESSGHTFMEVDSMHSSIEKEQRFVPVYSVSDWMNVMRRARSTRNRKSARPYNVQQLTLVDIVDLKDLSKCIIKNRTKDEDGNQVNWLRIKCLRYEKLHPGKIKYRYGHDGSYNTINILGRGRPVNISQMNIKKAYDKLLPISTLKKNDLLKLCHKGIIPQELHPWYESLPTDSKIVEKTTEPAIGEESDEDPCI